MILRELRRVPRGPFEGADNTLTILIDSLDSFMFLSGPEIPSRLPGSSQGSGCKPVPCVTAVIRVSLSGMVIRICVVVNNFVFLAVGLYLHNDPPRGPHFTVSSHAKPLGYRKKSRKGCSRTIPTVTLNAQVL